MVTRSFVGVVFGLFVAVGSVGCFAPAVAEPKPAPSPVDPDPPAPTPESNDAAPAITSFEQDKVVRAGEVSSVTAVFTGGRGVVEGLGPITSGVPLSTGKLDVTKTLTLVVTAETGEIATATTEVEAAVTPVIQSFFAPGPAVSRHVPTQLTAVFTGGKGTIDQDVGAIESGKPATTKDVPRAGATFVLTVTNGLGESVTKTLSVTTKREIVVTGYDGDVSSFDIDAAGNVPPNRVLSTGAIGLVGMAISNREIFVAAELGTPSISVFDLDARGTTPPKRKIMGAATGWGGDIGPYLFSVDGAEIVVADKSNAIKVWNVADNGNVAPKRSIAGAATGLDNTLGVTVTGGEILATNYAAGGAATLTAYPRGASGNVAPLRTIAASSPPTGVVANGNELFVGGLDGSVTVYHRTTKAQLRKISGPATLLGDNVYQCALGGDELFCASYDNGRIDVFPANASGNVAPKRTIEGLSGPVTVVID